MALPNNHEQVDAIDSLAVERAWRELAGARRQASIHKRISPRPALNVFFAIDDNGRPGMLVIGSPVRLARLPTLESLELQLRARTDGQMTLGIYLADSVFQSAFAQLFAAIGNDLFKAPEQCNQIEFVLNRVRTWQQFLERARSRSLSLPEQQGLWGELVTVEWLLKSRSAERILQAWKGPTHEAQDFRFDDIWIECKTIGPLDDEIKVANLQQFEFGTTPLHLVIHSIAEDSSGCSLSDKVARIRGSISENREALDHFERLLRHAGYSDDHDYPTNYLLQRSRWYRVSERFPRLANSNIPEGVTTARYQIRVSALNNFIEAEPACGS